MKNLTFSSPFVAQETVNLLNSSAFIIPPGSDGGICCRSNIGCCGSHLLYGHLCGSVPKDHE